MRTFISLFFLCSRHDDILNLYAVYLYNSIADSVEYYIGMGSVRQLQVSKCRAEPEGCRSKSWGLGGKRVDRDGRKAYS